MAKRTVITVYCDQCGNPVPTLLVWVDLRSTAEPLNDVPDIRRLDFCSDDCLEKWGEEHKG